MSQRTNRAFYSEPLISFPGRLHITAEKICVEVLVKEDEQRKFRSFTPDEFEELINILCRQDFHREGFEEAYRQELYEIAAKANHFQIVLFNNGREATKPSFRKKEKSIPKSVIKKVESADIISNEDTTETAELSETISTKDELLGNIVTGLSERASDVVATASSPEVIPIIEEPLFEENECDEILESNLSEEKISSITSKYIGKFANLHIQKINGKYAPDKAIFLMSVISLYDGGNKHRSSTIICNKELEQLYDSKWKKYRPSIPLADFKKTFLSLCDESFWHLDSSGKQGELSAQIDLGLAMTLNQQNSRSLLRKTLYNRYLK